MEIGIQTAFKFALPIAAVAAIAAYFDSFFFTKTIIAAVTVAATMYYSLAQASVGKAPSKKKETFSHAIITPAFAVFMVFFFFDLLNGNINLPLSLAGLMLVLLGTFFYAKNLFAMGKFFSTFVEIKKSHKLITTGDFGIIRHPLYLGALALYAGTALEANSLACAAIFVFFFVPWTLYRIKIEEKMLQEEFGKEFEAYKKSVPALIPKLF